MFYPQFSLAIPGIFSIILLLSGTFTANADVVKPALTEIAVHADGRIIIEIRTSLEALLSGIDGRYRNTQEAPSADLYDKFRIQSAQELQKSFQSFHSSLLAGVDLRLDRKSVALAIESIEIPEP
ncbi:MAG: hypothetical protein HKN34_10925, partial [Gammaproteobacteria bacterium]|nr:hypothetical protein [Gammaproteobacteria bacterium]